MPSAVRRVPVLLLIGETGTGKSDASYHVFSRLYRSGTPTARLDLDDVGMSHPAPPDDPDNFRVKAEAMAACWEVFRTHGATCLVVSGALDSREVLDLQPSSSRTPTGRSSGSASARRNDVAGCAGVACSSATRTRSRTRPT